MRESHRLAQMHTERWSGTFYRTIRTDGPENTSWNYQSRQRSDYHTSTISLPAEITQVVEPSSTPRQATSLGSPAEDVDSNSTVTAEMTSGRTAANPSYVKTEPTTAQLTADNTQSNNQPSQASSRSVDYITKLSQLPTLKTILSSISQLSTSPSKISDTSILELSHFTRITSDKSSNAETQKPKVASLRSSYTSRVSSITHSGEQRSFTLSPTFSSTTSNPTPPISTSLTTTPASSPTSLHSTHPIALKLSLGIALPLLFIILASLITAYLLRRHIHRPTPRYQTLTSPLPSAPTPSPTPASSPTPHTSSTTPLITTILSGTPRTPVDGAGIRWPESVVLSGDAKAFRDASVQHEREWRERLERKRELSTEDRWRLWEEEGRF